MRGVRFNMHDVTLHADAIHRGGDADPNSNVAVPSLAAASPRVMSLFHREHHSAGSHVSGVYNCVPKRAERSSRLMSSVQLRRPPCKSSSLASSDLRAATGVLLSRKCT